MNMRRINVFLPPQMLEALGEKSKADGRNVSEHIRQAITEYLRSMDNAKKLGRDSI